MGTRRAARADGAEQGFQSSVGREAPGALPGEHDKQVVPDRVRQLYADLGSKQKVLIELACSSHNAMWEKNRLILFKDLAGVAARREGERRDRGCSEAGGLKRSGMRLPAMKPRTVSCAQDGGRRAATICSQRKIPMRSPITSVVSAALLIHWDSAQSADQSSVTIDAHVNAARAAAGQDYGALLKTLCTPATAPRPPAGTPPDRSTWPAEPAKVFRQPLLRRTKRGLKII
jgi:hypothetical protein